MTDAYLIGNWTMVDSTPGQTMNLHFMDKENVQISGMEGPKNIKYAFTKKDTVTILTLIYNLREHSKFVIVPKGENVFLMYLPGDYERALKASSLMSGTIAWGWTNPEPKEFRKLASEKVK